MELNSHLHPLLFMALFVGAWVAVSLLISHLGGWASLAGAYQAATPFSGERWKFQSASMRHWTNYGNCLTLGANYEGLCLSILFLFRVGHPPLLIPWREISARRKRVLGREIVELRLGRELDIPFRITQRLAERLRAAAGSSWPVEAIG